MKCPRCTSTASTLASEPGTYGTLRRRYLCAGGHHFATLEAYEPQGSTIERTALMKVLRAIATTLRRTPCR